MINYIKSRKQLLKFTNDDYFKYINIYSKLINYESIKYIQDFTINDIRYLYIEYKYPILIDINNYTSFNKKSINELLLILNHNEDPHFTKQRIKLNKSLLNPDLLLFLKKGC